MRYALASAVIFGGLALAGCTGAGDTYTLYRNSPVDAAMRIHVASFDAKERNADAYNRENCELAAKLYQAQGGVTARFWCEKGAFRK